MILGVGRAALPRYIVRLFCSPNRIFSCLGNVLMAFCATKDICS